jgi:hypothetical protein
MGTQDSPPVPRLEAVFTISDDFWQLLHPETGTVAPLRFGQRLVTAPTGPSHTGGERVGI